MSREQTFETGEHHLAATLFSDNLALMPSCAPTPSLARAIQYNNEVPILACKTLLGAADELVDMLYRALEAQGPSLQQKGFDRSIINTKTHKKHRDQLHVSSGAYTLWAICDSPWVLWVVVGTVCH